MNLTILQIGSTAWRFSWANDGNSPWRVYHEGRLLATRTATFFDIEKAGSETEPPALEIVGANVPDGDVKNLKHSPRATLQWAGVTGASYYTVEEYSGGEWVGRKRIGETGAAVYSWQTGTLADCAQSQWRVKAVGAGGTESAEISFSFFVVRNPDPPDEDMAYAAGDVTIGGGS